MTATAERPIQKATYRETRNTIPAAPPLKLTPQAPGIVTGRIGSITVTREVYDQLDPATEMDTYMARLFACGHRTTIGLLEGRIVRSGYCHADHKDLPLLILEGN